MLPVVRARRDDARDPRLLGHSRRLTLASVAWGQFGLAYLFAAIVLDARLLQLA